MNSPLDEARHNRIGAVRAARVYSNVVSPPTIFVVLGLALAWHELPLLPGFLWAAVYGLIVSLAPILFVLYLLKTGRIKELHMSNTGERHLPYLSAVFFALLVYGLIVWFDGPELLRCLSLFNVVELVALALINIFWLISIHATGVMAALVIVGLVYGWAYSLIVLPFVVSVVWVRLYLKRHTPMQVTAGLLLGVVSVLVLTLFGCFQ
jgi:membrane-associated phospholipid phosphatase